MTAELHITLRAIVHRVAAARRVQERLIYSRRQDKAISEARQIVYWLTRELPGLSSPVIGRLLNRDHSTVLQGAKEIEARRQAEPALAAELDALKHELMVSPRAHFGGLLADPDAYAAARRVAFAPDPISAGLRLSALENAAMAVRLVDLEDIAAATFQLFARCDLAFGLTGDDAREHAAGTRELMAAIADGLAALGYDTNTNEEEGAAHVA